MKLNKLRKKLIKISVQDYRFLKKKAELADNLLLQLEASLEDMRHGRIKRVA